MPPARRAPPAFCARIPGLWREVLPLAALPRPTLVLRDYLLDNLMLRGPRQVQGCGLLDFRTRLRPGELTSCRCWKARGRGRRARGDAERLAAFQASTAPRRSAAILAAQRNAKIIGIFTRLWRRDGKPQYLDHIPRVWRLLEADLQEPALRPLAHWLDRHLPRAARRVPDQRNAA